MEYIDAITAALQVIGAFVAEWQERFITWSLVAIVVIGFVLIATRQVSVRRRKQRSDQ